MMLMTKAKHLRKAWPIVTLSTIDTTWTGLGSIPDLRAEWLLKSEKDN
jgi:hypothetical protein